MKRLVIVATLFVASAYAGAQEQALTLDECRNLAIKNNKELQISGAKVDVAANNQKAAFTKYFPQLSAEGAYLRNSKNLNLLDMDAIASSVGASLGSLSQLPAVSEVMQNVNDLQHIDIKNVWVGGVSLVQPVFMGGKIVTYNQITQYAKDLAKSMNNQQLQDVIYKTDETYWQVISLVNKKKLADAYVDLLRKTDHG